METSTEARSAPSATPAGINEPLLAVRGLCKYFPLHAPGIRRKVTGLTRAVEDVSFDLGQGESLGLVGESGCGKTTTARCILRAIQPTAGAVISRLPDNRTIDL